MCNEQIGSSVVTTSPRNDVAGERYETMLLLLVEAVPLPRMAKEEEEVANHSVPLLGPAWVEVVTEAEVEEVSRRQREEKSSASEDEVVSAMALGRAAE